MVQTIQREFRSGCVKTGADLAKSIGSNRGAKTRRAIRVGFRRMFAAAVTIMVFQLNALEYSTSRFLQAALRCEQETILR
jgi:hypothetical protein